MPRHLSAEEFLEEGKFLPIIDVRSPGEFEKGHIPGAYNIPLFTDEERAEIGTLYKQTGRQEAILRGLELAGPKLAWYVKESMALSQEKKSNNKVLIHCWRGGMRSGSFAWFCESADMEAGLLVGGYKSYRTHIRSVFAKIKNLFVLGGMTGSGKTEILSEMRNRGVQIIDLEELASHKGSAFGSIGMGMQPTTEQFENDTAAVMQNFDLNSPIWIEDEGLKVGRCVVNEVLFSKMRESKLIVIDVPRKARVDRIERDYMIVPAQELIEVVHRITKRLGGDATKETIKAFEEHRYREAIEILLNYYDKGYGYGMSKRPPENIYTLRSDSGSVAECTSALLDFVKSV